MSYNITTEEFYERMSKSLQRYFGVKPQDASKENLYKVKMKEESCIILRIKPE